MAQARSTRLHLDPPMQQWRVALRNGRTHPVIATGHQPTLYHPGIVAKDLAAASLAHQLAGKALHVRVEHQPHDPLGIDLPTLDQDSLSTQRLVLDTRPGVGFRPPNRLPALNREQAAHRLDVASQASAIDCVRQGLASLSELYANLIDAEHLADQSAAIIHAIVAPLVDSAVQSLSTSELVTPVFVERLLADPVGCVRCYNRAAAAYPEAKISPLYMGRDVVEAPLWAQADSGASDPAAQPVYVDLGDRNCPVLFTHAKQVRDNLDLTGRDALRLLRPRAVSLSAIMRSERCDLFIHGTGGGVYDRVTDRWWGDWVGEPLAPSVVVSADMTLPLEAHTTTRADRDRAVWLSHHLPHNLDRYTSPIDEAESELRSEKCRLLDQMNEDRDKRRRAGAFKRIHEINAELQQRHAERLAAAHSRAQQAERDLRNAAIARRRDWCAALYPEHAIVELADAIRSQSPLSRS